MRVLSGIQPSGSLHIGNYFGMMKTMISHMENADLYVFIVDLHALTSVHDRDRLAQGTVEAAADFMALGLDPDKCTFWVQSDVPEVCELTWVLSTMAPMGLLERCHSYKDKIAKGISPSHGLFSYPILMAADILLYQAERVPVGKDQNRRPSCPAARPGRCRRAPARDRRWSPRSVPWRSSARLCRGRGRRGCRGRR